MKRAIILKYIFVTNLATPPADVLASAMSQWSPEERSQFAAGTAQMSMQVADQLKAAGLWRDVEENERRFFQTGIDQISPQQRIDASWLAESIVCLLWALQIVPELPSYDQQASHESAKLLPGAPIKVLLQQARLRSHEEIKKQRSIAELWHWRARTRRLQEKGGLEGKVPKGWTIEQIIGLSASDGNERGDLPKPIESDFPAIGKPYRDLSSVEFSMMTSIAQERHKAFNWLCGLSPTGQWADTPTDT